VAHLLRKQASKQASKQGKFYSQFFSAEGGFASGGKF
jgi:hypothetical protein